MVATCAFAERLTVRAGSESVLVADYSVLVVVEPRLEDNRIGGSVRVPLSNLRLHESSLSSLTTNTIQDARDELAELHKQAINRWLEQVSSAQSVLMAKFAHRVSFCRTATLCTR